MKESITLDLSDENFRNAYDAIDSPFKTNIFITGGAGTGKSLILKSYYERLISNRMNVAVVCPTGVASAMLADKGVPAKTIHSLFLLPPNPIFEKKIEMPRERMRLIKKLDYLMIDEVSMLSPSLFDHIMWILRELKFKGNIILFGDAMQLSPVVNLNDPSTLDYYISNGYISKRNDVPQFYNSIAYKELSFIPYILTTIYRQKDSEFSEILSRIRLGEETDEDLRIINTRVCKRGTFYNNHKNLLYLTPLNRDVDRINEQYNNSFIGKPYKDYVSKNVGSLETNEEETVRIYEGQQVMCIHNNSEEGYQNGTLGTVVELNDKSLVIESNDTFLTVQREKWSDYKIDYDTKTKEVKVNEIGSYEQIGCKPAFASTIHKAQGLTLDAVYIDLNTYYIPSSGVYLALSRARTLDGIGLSRPIRHSDIRVNKDVKEFYLTLSKIKPVHPY